MMLKFLKHSPTEVEKNDKSLGKCVAKWRLAKNLLPILIIIKEYFILQEQLSFHHQMSKSRLPSAAGLNFQQIF